MLFSCCFLQSGDKAYVLCFVEFENAKCARGPMKELQGSNSTSFGLWFVHVFIFSAYSCSGVEAYSLFAQYSLNMSFQGYETYMQLSSCNPLRSLLCMDSFLSSS